ncbi:MAG: hypothetical protein N3A69_02875 [Leptospiraceae bacterium]|nr:hypothetical protein [Leptospiraceae bacterium]
MSEGIRNLRAWAKARAVYASSEEAENLDDKETVSVPKLKQEYYSNPFIK